MSRPSRGPLILVLLWASVHGAAGQAAATRDGSPELGRTPPADDRPSWTVGYSVLSTVSVDPEYLYLSYSIPLVLREKLFRVRSHRLDDQEREVWARELVRAEARRVSAALNQRRDERDAAAAKGGGGTKDRDRIDELITGLSDQIRYLEALDPGAVVVAERKPVVFWATPETGGTSLLESPRYSPLESARANKLDLLVFGTLEQVQDYLFVTVRAMSFPGGSVVMEYQDALLPSQVFQGLEGLADELAGHLLGEPWGTVEVRVTPSDAAIQVDDVYLGAGVARLEYAPVGEVTVHASSAGHADEVRTVTVVPGETTTVSLELASVPVIPIGITSDPLLADVYVDSRWVGRTPLEVPRPAGLARVEILREGRVGERLHLSPDSPAVTHVNLPVMLRPPDVIQTTARNRFYGSLGAFIVSLPVPILLWAVSMDQATAFLQAQATGNIQDQIELAVNYRRLYGGYLGGVFLSAGLAVNVILNLVTYITAADRPAG